MKKENTQRVHVVGDVGDLQNHRFQNYVQNVAFHMTLSKAMISMLGLIRDYGWPLYGAHENGNYNASVAVLRTMHGGRSDSHVMHFRSLEHRGLATHHPSPGFRELQLMSDEERVKWKNHRHYQLTRAGELMCELLVEAGLLPPKEQGND